LLSATSFSINKNNTTFCFIIFPPAYKNIITRCTHQFSLAKIKKKYLNSCYVFSFHLARRQKHFNFSLSPVFLQPNYVISHEQLFQLICRQLPRNHQLSPLFSLMGTSSHTRCFKLNVLLWINTATGFAYKATSVVLYNVLISRVVLIPITSV
jgi:hypothetical protein